MIGANNMINDSAILAQLVEHLTCNEDVVGSIPTDGSTFYPGSVAQLVRAFDS